MLSIEDLMQEEVYVKEEPLYDVEEDSVYNPLSQFNESQKCINPELEIPSHHIPKYGQKRKINSEQHDHENLRIAGSWSIVEFEDGVQLVPDLWLHDKGSYWPNLTNNNKINRLIEECAEPDEGKWCFHHVIKIFCTSSDYRKGMAKLKLYKQIYDIENTSPESEKPDWKKRRKIGTSTDEEMVQNLKKFPSYAGPPIVDFSPIADFSFQRNIFAMSDSDPKMKREQNMFAQKIFRSESSKQETFMKERQPNLHHDTNENSASDPMKTGGEPDEISALPDCWSMEQYENFKKKYGGLIVHNKKLGCSYCARSDSGSLNVKGIHVSIEWASCSIVPSGRDKTIQQASLRKKMNEHFLSKAHSICVKRLQDSEDDAFTKLRDKMKLIYSTNRVFNTVYSLAKRNPPCFDVEDEIKLQIKNGIDMVVELHSRKSAVKIVDHIAKQIKKEVFSKIIEKNLKICVIIDEVSTISSKPVVVIFLKVEDCHLSPTIFLDLIELENQRAETIYTSLLSSLKCAGFDNDYLRNNLIAFCSDSASVMFGRNSGVGAKLKNDFPNIVIWHCLSHRLQLVLDDSVNDIKQVNHFKIFMDKIYTLFHQSNKIQVELVQISEELGQQLLKIGRVLGPRWVASSLRSALAVWLAYPALYKYFSTETKHSGMAARLSNKYFLYDLALMIDILQEISLLSEGLQTRCLTLSRAEKLIKRSIKVFEMLKESMGTYEKKIDDRMISDEFKDIQFVENHSFVSLPREKLLEAVIENMEKRLMDYGHLTSQNNSQENNNKLHELLNLLEPDTWNMQEVVVPWQAAEEKLSEFSEIFHHSIPINDFRDYVENVLKNSPNPVIPQSVQKAKAIISTIALSSAEVERGFSTLNIIYSDKRSNLTVENVANFMTINLVGLPLDLWNSIPYVETWLEKSHIADDNRVKQKAYDDNQVAIWKFLK